MANFDDVSAELDEQLDSLYGKFRESEDHSPKHLFHYSTGDGLVGITTGHVLRASHSQCLNDVSEPAHAQDILKRSIDTLKSECSPNSLTKELLTSFWDWALFALDSQSVATPALFGIPILFNQAPDLYVFCLSEESDLLSQWRAYSEHGRGYALGFSSAGLKSLLMQSKGQSIVRVVYDEATQLKQAKKELGSVIKLVHDFEERIAPTDDDQQEWITKQLFNRLLNEVIRLQAKFKSPAYQEEKEWRILQFVPRDALGIEIHFRATRDRLVPYVELDFGQAKRVPLPIERVTVGPTLDPELSRKTLNMLFTKRGYHAVRVENSRVPFRL